MQKCVYILLHAILFVICNFQSVTTQEEKTFLRNVTTLQSLRIDILKGYNKFVRPAEHNETTKVEIQLIIFRLNVDVSQHTMSVRLMIRFLWIDNKLKWNPKDYSGLDKMIVANHEIWLPDIYLENSATGNKGDILDFSQCVANHNGLILWAPQVIYVVPCNLDLTYWPFDKHTCLFKFRSWSHHCGEIEVTYDTGNNITDAEYPELNKLIDISDLLEREWKLTHVKKLLHHKPCKKYSYLSFWFTATRESTSYFFLLLCASLVMELMILLMFSYPLHSQMRLMISCIITAYICVFIYSLSQHLLFMGYKPPRIVVFYSFHLVIVFVATIYSVFSHSVCSITRSAPRQIMSVINGPARRFLYLQAQQDFHVEDLINGREEINGEVVLKAHHRKEWCLISTALDRSIFIILITTFLSLIASFKL